MANAGLILLWNDVKTGREKMAGELFNSTLAYCEQKVKEGVFESYEPVILASHGGQMNGYIMTRGDADKLDALRHTSSFKDLTTRCVLCLNGFGVVDAYLGNELGDMMKRWATNIPR